ncbi:TIGR01841 family phasin [Paraburkholderia sp.]|uniref:TIGR01841 family phasin n=1 Tax=Paraburkholderia sp. TaxID=1926495 RepID=UPI0025D4586F|nr:TIGR01841 family phasin [Paraburkholderia sp.]
MRDPSGRVVATNIPGEEINVFSSKDLMQFYGANISLFISLACEASDGVQKLAELNLQAAHSVLADSVARLREMQSDAATVDWPGSPLRLAQFAVGKSLSYQLHAYDIAIATETASAKIIDAHYDQFARDLLARVESWATQTPTGSETTFIAVKSAFSTASDAAETMRKSVRSVVEGMQANVSAMIAGASRTVTSHSDTHA